jgi:prophage regulatory protein
MAFMKRKKNAPAPVPTTTEDNRQRHTRLLRASVVADRVGLSIPTLWRLRRAGNFPQPIRLSPGAVAFRESDIEAWIEQRAAASEA